MITEEYPNLFQLLGYLNQDWDCDFETWRDAVKSFIEGHSEASRFQAALELGALLKSDLDERALLGLLPELGCFYDPRAEGLTVRQWLREIYDMVRLDQSNST